MNVKIGTSRISPMKTFLKWSIKVFIFIILNTLGFSLMNSNSDWSFTIGGFINVLLGCWIIYEAYPFVVKLKNRLKGETKNV
jgi:hypothetical protein